MAIAAVLFALPFAIASTVFFYTLNGLGLSEAAVLYVTAGMGGMISFLIAGSLAGLVARH